MKQLNIAVHPSVKADLPMRDILGINNLPRINAFKNYAIQKQWFDELNLGHVRHHDAALDNPGQKLLDISRVFPLFQHDETDPDNYYFEQSDDYMKTLNGSRAEIDYRLGESIDHSENARLVQMPKDPEKWARICRHIIAHYKDGAMNGMHLNIKRVTVWEESDNPHLFGGTVEDYSKLYCAVYREFKKHFPDIQVGGPTTQGWNERGDIFLRRFLDICKEQEIEPDYISITHYPRELHFMPDSVKKVRGLLDERGFTNSRINIVEWHLRPVKWDFTDLSSNPDKHGFSTSMSAAFAASSLIRLMDIDYLDTAYYYAWGNNAFSIYWLMRSRMERMPVYFGLKFFNAMTVDCSERLAVEWDGADNIDVLAGKTADGKVRLLVSCYETGKTSFSCKVEGAVSCAMKAVCSDYQEADAVDGCPLVMNEDGSVAFGQRVAGSDVFLLEFTMEA